MMEVVMDLVVNEVIAKEVDKELTKVVEEVNKMLVKEVNEGLVLVWKCGDGRRGDHEVDCGHKDDVANVAEFSHQKSLKVHMVTTYWRKAICMWTMC